jgi:hypothetical protein
VRRFEDAERLERAAVPPRPGRRLFDGATDEERIERFAVAWEPRQLAQKRAGSGERHLALGLESRDRQHRGLGREPAGFGEEATLAGTGDAGKECCRRSGRRGEERLEEAQLASPADERGHLVETTRLQRACNAASTRIGLAGRADRDRITDAMLLGASTV